MNNQQIAKIFDEIADILDLKGENVFRVRAYRRAALNISSLSRDVAALADEELADIPGIGDDLAAKIREYLETGKIAKHETLKRDIPGGVLDLLRVPGLGPKTVNMLHEKLRIKSLDELAALANAGKLAGLPGLGKKTEKNIIEGIELVRRGNDRRPLGRILPLAEEIIRQIKGRAPVDKIVAAGSIRRRRETVQDIDILATSQEPGLVMEAFVRLPQVSRVLMHGPTRSSIVTDEGVQVDVRVVAGEDFGAALQYFTGSKQHNIRVREMAVRAGLKISEYGVFREPGGERIGGEKEEDVYRALGLPFIPPELREDEGEIEAAQQGVLPRLIELADIKGDLHVHTRWSDGSHDIAIIAEVARERGYEYIAITDHTKGLGIAHGLDEARLEAEIKSIDEENKKYAGFHILKGTEVDIRTDGRLDLPDAALAGLDIVVASIHSGFRQSQEQITQRLLAAVRNPCVSVIAHPTGRVIGERDAYAVDMEAVLKEAARYGVAMEINSYPMRLDLNDVHIKMAKEYGVAFVISTDTHVADQYDNMTYGVSMARRGWLGKNDVLNTLSCEQLLRRLRVCRPAQSKGR